jgi:DhnA family fructose-bisphosphate aldolase class Ia
MKEYRLKRLFNARSGKCFDVAIDHGLFNEASFLNGIENIGAVVETIAGAGPDAIQLSTGQVRHLQSIRGKHKPALVLRTDVANVYGPSLSSHSFSKMIHQAALEAVRADAACLCVNLFCIPGAPEVTAQCIDNILKLKTDSDLYAMPLMIEPLVFRPNTERGGYLVDGDLQKILPLVRQAVELGADIVKADPTNHLEDYHRVVEMAGNVPVLVRGGSKAGNEEIIVRTKKLMNQGVAGIVYGRNIIQHSNPVLITRVLMEMIHNDLSEEACLKAISLSPSS